MDYTGQVVDGKYTLIRLLAEGGMGMVYLGQHNIINRRVAVKVLHGKYQGNENMVRRFYREAQAASAIEHKNIIEIIDVGVTEDNAPCLVMEYLEGESLADLLKRTGPIDIAAACGIMEPVLNALGAAHDKGVFHRDLKPENIFIVHIQKEPPIVKLIDFGISKIKGDDTQPKLTQTGAIMGTPLYMAPEQLQATEAVDQRTDLYALGVIFYEMLTGALPFAGENCNQMLAAMLTQTPRPPKDMYEKFPSKAEPLLMKALAKDQDERFQNVDEFLAALKKLADFQERRKRLTMYTSSITSKKIASGDLGEADGDGDSVEAADVLSELATSSTPGEWYNSTNAPPKIGRWPLWIGVTVGVCACLVLVAVLLSGEKEEIVEKSVVIPAAVPPKNTPPTPETEPKPIDTGVQIEIVGVPKDAVITYDGMAIDMNPFPVEKVYTIKKLKIEAKGYAPIVKGIIPSESQQIRISLEPEELPVKADTPAIETITTKKDGASDQRTKKIEKNSGRLPKKGKTSRGFINDF